MSKWRALVAEDSSIVLFNLETLLAQCGIDIVGAAATLNAMRKLVETVPADIAILDVNLDGELVFPVADLLLERGIPVVFTTGYAPENLFPPHLLAYPVMQKPYDPDEFLRIVDQALQEGKSRREGTGANAPDNNQFIPDQCRS